MDDRKIEVFLAAARTGSFSKAAQECHCTQSAVTQLMNSLEAELGCTLLERTHAGVRLTSQGEELLPHLQEADVVIARLKVAAAQLHRDEESLLHIGAFSSIATTWLPQAIAAFKKEHPKVNFDVHVGTAKLRDWLKEGTIDLALGDDWLFDTQTSSPSGRSYGVQQWYPLMDDPFYAVVPAQTVSPDTESITQEELLRHPLISAPMNALEERLSLPAKPAITVTTDDDSTLLSMVANGMGVTAMPALSLRSVPPGVLVLHLDPPIKRVLGVALPQHPNRQAQEFVRFLVEHAGMIISPLGLAPCAGAVAIAPGAVPKPPWCHGIKAARTV